jgi:thiol-disulfide isomerase/thioredoxin
MPTTKKTKTTTKMGKHAGKHTAKHHTTKNNASKIAPKKQSSSGKHLNVTDAKTAAELRTAMKNGRVIVLYHAEWCGHCKDFMPEWQKFIAVMKNKSEVDCMTAEVESANLGLIPEAGVEGFPTIRYYNAGPVARAPSENTERATGLAALFGLADETREAAKGAAGNGTDYTGARTSNALLEYVSKTGKQSGGAAAKKVDKKVSKPAGEGVFKELVKKGLNPKTITPVFKREYRRLERASKHAKETLREIKKSIGFKN